MEHCSEAVLALRWGNGTTQQVVLWMKSIRCLEWKRKVALVVVHMKVFLLAFVKLLRQSGKKEMGQA